jgi:TPR repeat protein
MTVTPLAAGMILSMLASTSVHADSASGLADFRQGRFAEAYQDWWQAAQIGDARSALFVGVLYDTGLGVPHDYLQALEWYRRAAEAGSPAGAFNAGVMYDAGRGVAPDPQKAAFWYARAAAKGFARAEYNLAMMYEAGSGVPRNPARAIQLYIKAANHGISAARTHLVALGQTVTGIGHDTGDTAMLEFQRAQQILLTRGVAEAAHAVELFQRAAEQHNSLAEYDLGYCYEYGIGVPRDLVQAYAWYRRAATDAVDDPLRSIAMAGARGLEGRLSSAQIRQANPAQLH